MTTFTLTIHCDGYAFGPDATDLTKEIARILRLAALNAENGIIEDSYQDSNKHRVGLSQLL